ncbi:MAG: RDD family protein, partial [Bacilli bacterium]|nr:RDD family protein [Bacilli bacterium]
QISKETGAVLVDELGVKRSDMGGSAYERYLKELMYSKYSKLEGFLIDYNATYKDAYTYKNNIELAARAVAIGLSVIIFATIIPLINKNAQTLGDKYMDIAYVKNKGGFKIKPYHTIFRGISLYYILPIIGVTIADKYAIISLVVFPLFVSTLLLLFRQSERDLRDLTSGTIAVLKGDSLFFKSAGEASLYEKKEENQIVEDQEYLEKLQNAAKVELETSRDEQFKNKQKEDKK